jgi:hypothetical protein
MTQWRTLCVNLVVPYTLKDKRWLSHRLHGSHYDRPHIQLVQDCGIAPSPTT